MRGLTASAAAGYAFAAVSQIHVFALTAGADPVATATKPLLMPLLACWVLARRGPRLLTAALLCGWAGDVLLMPDSEPLFLAGMGAFALGHLCYLRLARTAPAAPAPGGPGALAGRPAALLAAGYGLVCVAAVALLWPGLEAGLRLPVAAYSLLLTAMAWAAACRLRSAGLLGGALFLLSDALIAADLAGWPEPPLERTLIMATYLTAQFCLAVGVVTAYSAPSPDGPAGGTEASSSATSRFGATTR
ncbi:lysoplasmalogenase [Streptomyces sp. YIM 98790]|uniref:lysoplasmalogenase n=1 Tax=Streptomyces sp. YIM 98790 TaxID=2689077 RepID=UPI001409F268|nr:lysoplasmalogenase [Streptomyces sp. YIM 98790]